jgi:hypothetical protein
MVRAAESPPSHGVAIPLRRFRSDRRSAQRDGQGLDFPVALPQAAGMNSSPIVRGFVAACVLACSGCVIQQPDLRSAEKRPQPPMVKRSAVLTVPRGMQYRFVQGDDLKDAMRAAFMIGTTDAEWLKKKNEGKWLGGGSGTALGYRETEYLHLAGDWTVEKRTKNKAIVRGTALVTRTPVLALVAVGFQAKTEVVENLDLRVEVRFRDG